jgi:uncharacterized membrane protein
MAAGEDPEIADGRADAALAALTARVALLERQVAELTRDPAARGSPRLISEAEERTPPPPPLIPEFPARVAERVPFASPTRDVRTLESRLGSQGFNLVGIVAIIVGVSWFLKLAIERGWLGPPARVLIGLLCGAGLVLWSEQFRRRGMAAFSYSLKALGTGVLYLSLWASFQLYHQLPASAALLLMVLVTAWNGFMAWSQDAELLAGYGLIGGFATPLLLSTGGNHETFLFTYVAAIDVAMVLLLRWKPWQRLLLPGFAATAAYLIGWYARFFHGGVGLGWNGESTETALFALVFFAIFAVVSIRGFRTGVSESGEVIVPVLMPLADAAFVACALYSVMQDSGMHSLLAWMMVALAALYLGLARVQATTVAGAMHLAAAVVFLTIAIPLKASGHTLTTAWLVEGLVLYWAATRVSQKSGASSKVLGVLSAAGYGLGLISLVWHWLWRDASAGFWNADLSSSLVAMAMLAGAAWLASRAEQADERTLLGALIEIDLVAVLLTAREVAVSPLWGAAHPAFGNAEFGTAVVGLAGLGAVTWVGYRLQQSLFAGVTLVVFNLLTILTVEREIGALWSRYDAGLQRSLAISGFLMVYGAVLLAAGFWRRSAFVRWQALLLLVFTIAKVFLYDISGLSQGYRVASFLGLGVLLMGISFAYQKDWLGLKTAPVGEDHA